MHPEFKIQELFSERLANAINKRVRKHYFISQHPPHHAPPPPTTHTYIHIPQTLDKRNKIWKAAFGNEEQTNEQKSETRFL